MSIGNFRRQSGDTIVEVLIVLTVLSSAFAISYATANRATLTSRQSQEHSEALQYLNAQVELLRTFAPNDPAHIFTTTHGSFCLAGSPVAVVRTTPVELTVPDVAAADNLSLYPPACSGGTDGRYKFSITYLHDLAASPPNSAVLNADIFILRVRWDGLTGSGIQQETIKYKLHP